MLSKNQIKEIRSLHLKKYRQKYDKFVVEGHKSCTEFIHSGKFDIIQIFVLHSVFDKFYNTFKKDHPEPISVSENEMKRLSMLKTPSTILMVCKKAEIPVNLRLNDYAQLLFLDRIQDPGNIGTIIRIADWFGIKVIILSGGCADIYNPKAIQASMGSLCNVTCIQKEFNDLVSENLNHSIIGTDMDGEDISDFNWPEKSVLVIGNEGSGIDPEIRLHIHQFVGIPGSIEKVADSLNVANATAILLYSLRAT